jgi:outer membrane lipoprotein LolB
MRYLLIASLLVVLSGCAPKSPPRPLDKQADWPHTQQQLQQVRTWFARGALGVKSADEGFNAAFTWRQQGEHYVITLTGPLGGGAVRLRGAPGEIHLKTQQGEQQRASDPEALLFEQTGLLLPVSQLYYWIRGLPAPGLTYTAEWYDYHYLRQLKQAGWQIDYASYQPVRHYLLPKKITLFHQALRLRIVIRQWETV